MLLILVLLTVGQLSAHIAPRIIGGNPARAGQFPFIAAIYKTTNDGVFFCGGALMNNEWILTSGYCVDQATLFTIYLGAYNLSTVEPNALKLSTDSYVVHPDFNPDTLENDIGLIKLRMPIQFSDYIKPVEFLPFEYLVPNSAGIMSMGWGQTSDDDESLANGLHFVHLLPISNDECKLTYGSQITDNMVCVAGSFNQGFCHGDTGTPLIKYRSGIRSYHVGIASFLSRNGCETTEPSGFTRTFSYVDWIRNITGIE